MKCRMLIGTLGLAAGAMTLGCVVAVEPFPNPELGQVIVAEPYPAPPPLPPWAPEHGYKNKVTFNYYPDVRVYYNPMDGQWVWFDHERWCVGPQLPALFAIRLGSPVIIDIEGHQPWQYQDRIERVYPYRPRHGGPAPAPDPRRDFDDRRDRGPVPDRRGPGYRPDSHGPNHNSDPRSPAHTSRSDDQKHQAGPTPTPEK